MFILFPFEYELYKPICGFFTLDVWLYPYCDNRWDGMRWDDPRDYLSILSIYVCAIEIEGYLTLIYEGSMHTWYEYM